MPRTGRRRSLTIAAAVIATLAAPAAAQAATYTVKAGEGPCGGADTACGTLVLAAGAVVAGDTVSVAPGTYAESPTFAVEHVTITNSGTAPVAVTGTMTFSGNGTTPSVLDKVVVAPSTAASTAVSVTGTAGVAVRDGLLLSSGGTGMTIANGAANSLTRSVVVSGASDGVAVAVAPGSAATSLTLDSSILSGGAGGTGLSVRTGTVLPPITAANATITARHITIAGSANGIVLDSSAAIGTTTAVGNIAATVTDSIVLGMTPAPKVFAGLPAVLLVPLVPGNTATLAFTRTDQTTAPNVLFVNPAKRNFHLRDGSPAIDKAQVTTGDSATDIDGQPRTVGAASDQGADEFVAQPAPVTTPPPPPVATTDGTLPVITITKPKANEKIKLTTTTTKTKTVTKNGKKTKVKKKTSKPVRIGFAGTASDKSGIKGVVLTLEQLTVTRPASAKASATTAPATKCRYFNPTKGIVLKSCAKPIVLVAKLGKDGAWTYDVKSTIKFSGGVYRIITAGADNSGAFGNGATSGDAVHRFTLVK